MGLRAWLAVLTMTFGTWTMPVHAGQGALTLGFMPYLNAETVLEKYTPLARYLGAKLGREVRIEVAKDYAEHIRRTGQDELDISFLGGSPYVVIGDEYGRKPLLARFEFAGKPTFRSVIFVAKDSPIQAVADLKGKTMAFGNRNSTLSTQVPLYTLIQGGVGLDDLKAHEHLRNHDNVVMGVEVGDFDAGAVAEEVFHEYRGKAVRVLAYSPELSTHVFVASQAMAPELRQAVADALLGVKDDPAGGEVLRAIGADLTGFVTAADSDYDLHRDMLGKVLPMLDR
ncbi:MAG: phosphate/phosphite/phosphonate ABC transporter substrate-binding protein [Alphaproteobacteria bacterium]|nr:phosphate/phosphite/phosphonate ABC transporter substrate-binding protein [Alphaproteobacteria bacterium]MBF0249894.1 phosphate/phosphite/phosphonate ABC transporter substrate-binding protein [Alphaproteobacteria bacterium]